MISNLLAFRAAASGGARRLEYSGLQETFQSRTHDRWRASSQTSSMQMTLQGINTEKCKELLQKLPEISTGIALSEEAARFVYNHDEYLRRFVDPNPLVIHPQREWTIDTPRFVSGTITISARRRRMDVTATGTITLHNFKDAVKTALESVFPSRYGYTVSDHDNTRDLKEYQSGGLNDIKNAIEGYFEVRMRPGGPMRALTRFIIESRRWYNALYEPGGMGYKRAAAEYESSGSSHGVPPDDDQAPSAKKNKEM